MPLTKPLVVWDGDCGFCRLWIERWRHLVGDRADFEPYQSATERFPEIPVERFKSAVQLMLPGDEGYSAAEAVFRLLALVPGWGWMHWLYRHLPGVAAVSEAAYRFIANHRPAFYKLTKLLWGDHFERPSYEATRWLFLRLLALIYLLAFASLHLQLPGLIGSRGMLPASNYLRAIEQAVGAERYLAFPTLAWFASSDAALRAFSLGGVALSLVGIAGVLPVIVFPLLWALYLSLLVVGQDFLAFQWDILLVETGFLAILFAAGRRPSRVVVWLMRLLLFRLMFSSGLVKLASGDSAWHNLTALRFHYETQPIPNVVAWYMHQLPAWFQTFSCVVMFAIELGVPWFLFAPRRLRLWAVWLIALLQVLIMLTGNYAFFNWLALALCIPAADDALWRRMIPQRLRPVLESRPERQPWLAGRIVVGMLAVVIATSGIVHVARIALPLEGLPWLIEQMTAGPARLHLVSGYGLFAVMTTSRPEIIVEGSNDAENWQAYEFKYKPGDLRRAPPFVAPHQPRLDWQMWFAALGDYRANAWFVNLMVRLLEGSPQVLALLEKNPFPEAPPQFIRASRYDYHFTDRVNRRAEGTWWRRKFIGLYFPVASLRRVASAPILESDRASAFRQPPASQPPPLWPAWARTPASP